MNQPVSCLPRSGARGFSARRRAGDSSCQCGAAPTVDPVLLTRSRTGFRSGRVTPAPVPIVVAMESPVFARARACVCVCACVRACVLFPVNRCLSAKEKNPFTITHPILAMWRHACRVCTWCTRTQQQITCTVVHHWYNKHVQSEIIACVCTHPQTFAVARNASVHCRCHQYQQQQQQQQQQ